MIEHFALWAVAVVYALITLGLFVFGSNLLLFSWRSWKRGVVDETPDTAPLASDPLPFVTVQLPLYNERYVADRVIEAACALDWPSDRLEIQVLDDSTDDTVGIVADAVSRARARGLSVVHRHRTDRTGYKAGALGEGLAVARGEYVAIFDSDFVPEPDFLRRAIPHFDAPNVAFVQARWGHLNRDGSWLTRLQALAIDGHFLVEQSARGSAGYWFNFNGTAGVWSVQAIHDAGGWQADTLTEDLDLSYRAHLNGWEGRFVEDLVVRAELPPDLASFRRQQHRWARGSVECAIGLLPRVWRADVPWTTRLQASLHLSAYTIQLLLLALLVLYPAVVIAGVEIPRVATLYGVGYVLALTSIAPTVFFVTGSRRGGRRWVRDIPAILLVTVVGSGLMANTARAISQIWTSPNPAFERTPKFGDAEASVSSSQQSYRLGLDRIVLFELVLAAWGLFGAAVAAFNHSWGILAYATIFTSGLFVVAVASVVDDVRGRLAARRAPRIETPDQSTDVLWTTALGAGLTDSVEGAQRDASAADEPAPKRAVVVMAKRPAAGRTKTRLAEELTASGAADLYEHFLRDTVDQVAARDDCDLILAVDDPATRSWFAEFAPQVTLVDQIGPDLGARLDAVLRSGLELGYDHVFAVGSDSPDLPPDHLTRAFDRLDDPTVDVVLGPTEDGGYWIVGWKQAWSPVVTDVTMSTEHVFSDTLNVARQVGARVGLAPEWYDVDRPEDLDRLRHALAIATPADSSAPVSAPSTRAFLARG